MKTPIIVAALALAIGASACGGSGEGPSLAERPIATATSPSGPGGRVRTTANGRRSTAKQDCVAAGITAPPFHEGACTQRGRRFVVADGRSTLQLKSLSAQITGVSAADALPAKGGEVAPQQGVFVLISLSVKNRTGATQQFVPGQTQLTIRDQAYEERTDVEGAVNARSLASPGHGRLAPGATGEGHVVFDVPITDLRRVTTEGTLYVANFADLSAGRHAELGVIRIYQE
jgi:hypothetical protein